MLTNRHHPLPEEYPVDIIRVGPSCDMDSKVAEDFQRMWDAVQAAGYSIGVKSSLVPLTSPRGIEPLLSG